MYNITKRNYRNLLYVLCFRARVFLDMAGKHLICIMAILWGWMTAVELALIECFISDIFCSPSKKSYVLIRWVMECLNNKERKERMADLLNLYWPEWNSNWYTCDLLMIHVITLPRIALATREMIHCIWMKVVH